MGQANFWSLAAGLKWEKWIQGAPRSNLKPDRKRITVNRQ